MFAFFSLCDQSVYYFFILISQLAVAAVASDVYNLDPHNYCFKMFVCTYKKKK